MKQEILERIKQLGGNIDNVKGSSLTDDLLAITFDTVLYQRPVDTPWASAEEEEPIYGIGDFIDENTELFKTDKQALYNKIIDKYFRLTEEAYGQAFWQPRLFTPFKEGTADFDEWNSDFTDEDTDLSEIIKVTDDNTPDFLQVFYSYGFPDNFFICLSDPNPDNPTFVWDRSRSFFPRSDE
ncbi:hypothetical protein LUD75_09285 [Epilithonimonas sp. JDS]|uniref:hypothetical protein n=1 Tax=Epilithonimonas sp. JDS TaxID=2902797 RepID=UPI001E39FD69|nr:hypothetical protein [Epilithonimonas sp. JDS]MCD9854897.1 hypothetical protein [Epilithonimonas sp. JDS]